MCLYPIVNHPGWEDERHCHNGLWDYCNESGHREIYSPLADELRRQNVRIEALLRQLNPGYKPSLAGIVGQSEQAVAGACY